MAEKSGPSTTPPPPSSEINRGCASSSPNLEHLPWALVSLILSKLDVASICSFATTCKAFNSCASNLLSFLPNFDLLDVAVTPDLLTPLLPLNPRLRCLKVNCCRLDDSSIQLLVRPSLHELCLFNCDNFTGLLLSEIGENCSHLRTLSLGSVGENIERPFVLTNLEKLLSGCPQLESLSLTFSIINFDWEGFPHVWTMASRNLKELKMGFIATEMVMELLNKKFGFHQRPQSQELFVLSNLQKIQLLVEGITDNLVTTISKVLTSLTHLDLEDAPAGEPDAAWDLTNIGLQHVNRHGKLRHLSLIRGRELISTFFRRVNDQGILLMAETCSSLESICLGGFGCVTDAGFRAILHSCSNLKKFTVCHGSQPTDLVFHDISATSLSLTHVGLRGCNLLTKLAIMQLAHNMSLRLLDLRHCRGLEDQALKAIGVLPKLKTLLVDGADISDSGVSNLVHGFCSLVSLSVRGCNRLTDKCMSTIFDSSFGQSLQVLDLSNVSNLSDQGILSLARSRVPLVELHLQNCPRIGDIAVIALASMQAAGGWCGSTLRLLDLHGCGITILAFKWFRKPYFPRLRWLGLTEYKHRDMIDALALGRPFLQLLPQEVYWDPDRFYRFEYENFDELERWLLDGEGDEEWLPEEEGGNEVEVMEE